MDPLTSIEQEIVWTRFYDGTRNWEDAAVACGRSPKDGKRLRRKFLKLKNAERQRHSAYPGRRSGFVSNQRHPLRRGRSLDWSNSER